VAQAPALLERDELRRLDGLALQVRRSVIGQMAGERRSRRHGRSVEFADFRSYTPGDDFRLIDWNAYARLDRYLLRLFVAEEELPLSLFLDLSGSMDWGNPNKAWAARRLAGAIAYVALAALDRVRLTVFADGPTSVGGRTDYARLTWPIGRQRPGMSVMITDGLGPAPMDPALAALQRARQEGALLQVLAPQELEPDWSGDARLKDAETGEEREMTSTPVTKAAYRTALARRTQELEEAARRRGLRFARVLSGQPVDEVTQRVLQKIGLLRRPAG